MYLEIVSRLIALRNVRCSCIPALCLMMFDEVRDKADAKSRPVSRLFASFSTFIQTNGGDDQ